MTATKRGAVLGTGPSLRHFDPANYDYSIGANDIYKYLLPFHEIDAVCAMDTYSDISKKRPAMLTKTPARVNMYFRNQSWRGFCKKRPGAVIVQTRRLNWDAQWDGKELLHGYVTPIFGIFKAWQEGCREIVVYGVDFNGHESLDHAQAKKNVIRDLNWCADQLERYGGALAVHEKSALWRFEETDNEGKLHKLNTWK